MLYDIDYSNPHYSGLNFQLPGDIENYPSITEAMIALFVEHKQDIEEA